MKYALTIIYCTFFILPGQSQSAWEKDSEELILVNAPFKSCHASSIIEVAPGKLMATFFGGSDEGEKDVNIWLATKKGKTWENPVSVADGIINDSVRYPCWNPVLFKTREGKLFLFYKVGPNPREWWGMQKTSVDLGKTWGAPERLPGRVLGPIKNKPVQLADGSILSPSSVEEKNNRWTVHMEKSGDLTKTWEIIPVDSAAPFEVIQPTILIYPGERLQILCRSGQDKIIQSWSDDKGKSWGPLSNTNLPNPNSGIDAVTLKNGLQLLVYNPTVKGENWFNNRGKLNVAISKDGISWKDIFVLENGEKEEFSYPAVIQAEDGRVHITYTYDRKNVKHVVLHEKVN
ncbi:MAG: sialidase family protein [Ferruginibacter sp.]